MSAETGVRSADEPIGLSRCQILSLSSFRPPFGPAKLKTGHFHYFCYRSTFCNFCRFGHFGLLYRCSVTECYISILVYTGYRFPYRHCRFWCYSRLLQGVHICRFFDICFYVQHTHEQLMYLTLWVHLLDKPPLWLIVRSIIVEMYEQCGYYVLWHIYATVCEGRCEVL